MSLNEERNKLIAALTALAESGETVVAAMRRIEPWIGPDKKADFLAQRSGLERSIAEARALLVLLPEPEPVVVERIHRDGTVSRVEVGIPEGRPKGQGSPGQPK